MRNWLFILKWNENWRKANSISLNGKNDLFIKIKEKKEKLILSLLGEIINYLFFNGIELKKTKSISTRWEKWLFKLECNKTKEKLTLSLLDGENYFFLLRWNEK